MNHLAHLLLAEGSAGWLAGAFLGDHVKGRLDDYPDGDLKTGLLLHRAIDGYTDRHPVCEVSRKRFDPEYRRYGGIMTDIIYDHFLSRTWPEWHPEPLTAFSPRVLADVLSLREHLPEVVIKTCVRLRDNDALIHYADDAFVERSFHYIGSRLRHDNPLAGGMSQFVANRELLLQDFHQFLPQLISFANDFKHDRHS